MSRLPSRQPPEEPGPPDMTDPHQFAAQFRSAYRRLTLVAAAVTGDRDAAEDIVQEAAMIAFEKAAQFTPGTNFAAWLAEIVRRCALNHRRKVRGRKTFAADPTTLGELNSGEAGLDEAWPVRPHTGELSPDQSSFDDRLIAALNELAEDARCCLLLRTVEGLSYAEISALMNIPEGTATSHVHRSRAILRRRLAATPHVDEGPRSPLSRPV